jgi:hypothetical protein
MHDYERDIVRKLVRKRAAHLIHIDIEGLQWIAWLREF